MKLAVITVGPQGHFEDCIRIIEGLVVLSGCCDINVVAKLCWAGGADNSDKKGSMQFASAVPHRQGKQLKHNLLQR